MENVDVAVATLDLEISVIGAMPLIDVFGHLNLPAVEVEPSKLFGAAFFPISLHVNLHDALTVAPAPTLRV